MSANDKQIGGTHYDEPIQHWDLCIKNKIPYIDGVALKYIMRHSRKGGKEDLQKAIHTIEKMIETYYPSESLPPIQTAQYVKRPSIHVPATSLSAIDENMTAEEARHYVNQDL